MNSFMKLGLALLLTGFSYSAFARGGGGAHSIGVGVSVGSPGQDDLDSFASAAGNIDKFGSGYEYSFNYEYRFSGTMFALQFKPGIFSQKASGSNGDMSLSGYSFFTNLRLYPLENNFIRFFLEAGVGYGNLNGSISQSNGFSASFSGGAFGAQGGLGAMFCFTDTHCMVIEGIARYLPIQRSTVQSSSGTPTASMQYGSGQELEINGNDLKTTMSGIQGVLGYQMVF